LYSSYDEESEVKAVGDRTIVILGSGPNRIGQGVEFDYCCVRATLAFREMGYRTVMVNSNPETVSTDYDISDTLYFEPLTLEDVLEIVHAEADRRRGSTQGPDSAEAGAWAQSRRRKNPRDLSGRGVWPRIVAGSRLSRGAGRHSPTRHGMSVDEAVAVAEQVGYPCWFARPMLGGRGGRSSTTSLRCATTSRAVRWRRAIRAHRFLPEDAFRRT
jgi:carbamoyl-phosphate synthase large subunit